MISPLGKKFLAVLGILILPLFFFLLTAKMLIFYEPFYHDQFEENNLTARFEKTFLENTTLDLFHYFQDVSEEPPSLFNEKEKTHLSDVKHLYQQSTYLFYFLFIFFLFTFLVTDNKQRSQILFYGSLFTIIIVLLLLNFVLTDFSASFTTFHELTFSNDYWQLDPATDLLIVLFPEDFFISLISHILKNTLIISLIALWIGVSTTFMEKI